MGKKKASCGKCIERWLISRKKVEFPEQSMMDEREADMVDKDQLLTTRNHRGELLHAHWEVNGHFKQRTYVIWLYFSNVTLDALWEMNFSGSGIEAIHFVIDDV